MNPSISHCIRHLRWLQPLALGVALLVLTMVSGCAAPAADPPPATPAIRGLEPGESVPAWLALQLREWAAGRVSRVPTAVWRFERDGQTVYYIPEPCCDRFNRLYAASGEMLCAPSGGFLGLGDGRCPGALPPAGQMTLVWRHPMVQVRK